MDKVASHRDTDNYSVKKLVVLLLGRLNSAQSKTQSSMCPTGHKSCQQPCSSMDFSLHRPQILQRVGFLWDHSHLLGMKLAEGGSLLQYGAPWTAGAELLHSWRGIPSPVLETPPSPPPKQTLESAGLFLSSLPAITSVQ